MDKNKSIEVTTEMLRTIWGISVETDDAFEQKEMAYASIFAGMLMAPADSRLSTLKCVEYKGVVLADRE